MAAPQDARRKRDEGPHKVQDAANRDADDAKWQQKKPDQGIEDQCKERHRPAQHQQNAPQEERQASLLPMIRPRNRKVPFTGRGGLLVFS
jgi:hypothetical protein